VIAVDTNVLVYAHRPDAEFHRSAEACVRTLAEDRAAWAIPWPCLHEFLAVVTRPRVFDPPTPLVDAIAQVEAWLESPSVSLLAEAPGYWPVLSRLLSTSRVTGPSVHDARVAALCLVHGVRELWSADRDFHRFDELSVRNPLVGSAVHERALAYGRRSPSRRKRDISR
jgi:toxin-antitoxin system PIN domain toxin